MVATFTEMILTLVSLVLAVLCYAIKELQIFGKLRWSKDLQGFWGEDSWYRKYKSDSSNRMTGMPPAPNNWYYRTFKLKYTESFPLSGTLLIFVTDGVHFMQFLFKIFLALSFLPLTGWIWAGVIWFGFGVFFTIFYKIFSR